MVGSGEALPGEMITTCGGLSGVDKAEGVTGQKHPESEKSRIVSNPMFFIVTSSKTLHIGRLVPDP